MLLWVPAQRCHIRKKKRAGQGETDEQQKEIKRIYILQQYEKTFYVHNKNGLSYVTAVYEKKDGTKKNC